MLPDDEKLPAYGALLRPLLHHVVFSRGAVYPHHFVCLFMVSAITRHFFYGVHTRKDFFMRSKSNSYLYILVCVSLLIALDVILTRFLSIQTQFLRVGFGFLPIAIAGIAYGPVWGCICGAVGDILGMLIYPTAAYFPGFTLTAALTGIVFGLILHKNKMTFVRLFLASAIVCILLNLLLDTLWLELMYGNGYLAILPGRIVKCVINIPIYTILLEIIWGKGLSRIPQRHSV